MAREARIGKPAWANTLAAIALLASGCALDSRELRVRKAAASGDGLAPAGVDAAAPRWRSQREPSAPAAAADAPDARSAGRDAAADAAANDSEAGSAPNPEGGTEAGSDPQADASTACHELVISSNWIDDFSNCLEIQGEVWHRVAVGEAFSTHTASEPICMADASPSAEGPSMLGFNLNQSSLDAEPRDYDARLHGVTGFRFRVSRHVLDGLPIPFVGVQSQNEIYCMPSSGYGDYELSFTDLRLRCWETSSGPSPDPEHIRALLFYYPAAWPGDPIGMCVSDLFAIAPPR
jgi:hypothetical protein